MLRQNSRIFGFWGLLQLRWWAAKKSLPRQWKFCSVLTHLSVFFCGNQNGRDDDRRDTQSVLVLGLHCLTAGSLAATTTFLDAVFDDLFQTNRFVIRDCLGFGIRFEFQERHFQFVKSGDETWKLVEVSP